MSALLCMQYPKYSTLIQVLRWQATHQPDRRVYTYLVDGENDEITLTYKELDRRARAIAAVLQRRDSFGKRALLLYPPGLEYIAAFFGCLYAGAIAVPAYPPQRRRIMQRLESIVADAQIEFALTTTGLISKTESLLSSTGTLPRIATDEISDDLADAWQDPRVDANALVLLQYTSGSTSAPKGVMVSHNNLMHNERAIQIAFQQTDQSIVVGWLPFYHDMGLIGNILQPLYSGARCIMMSPLAFLQRPFRWLQAISKYKATTSGGPNFAYELCARKVTVEERATLDLSSWNTAFNGSEPVRAETLELFASTFAGCGFRRNAFRPCYGLAEATLLVSSHLDPTPPSVKTIRAVAVEQHRIDLAPAEDPDSFTFVSCGEPLLGQKIVIVYPETSRECLANEIGEIWISGPSVAQGYWSSAQETDDVFHAHLTDSGDGPFLRTGDLGFLLDGRLFVTGRLKDLIIIRGRNLYPTDIELTVERSHSALRQGCGAAFSVEIEGEERLVVVQEIDLRQRAPIDLVIDNIRESVSEEFEVSVHAIVLIKPGSIPKTSSGKIQRRATRMKFLEGTLDVVSQYQATYTSDTTAPESVEDLEGWLSQQFANVLRIDVSQIDLDEPVTRYGIDSLMAIELLHRIQSTLAVDVPLTSFFQGLSLAQLTTQIREHHSKSSIAPVQQDGAEPLVSYGQRALWIMHKVAPDSAAYNIAHAARIRSHLDVTALRRAFQTLLDRHASLRTTYEVRQGTPISIVRNNAQFDFQEVDATSWSETALKDYLTAEAHRPFDLTQDLPLRVYLLNTPEHEYILLLVVHHIAADLWSLAVLTYELGLLYANSITLAPVELQYTDYARFQMDLLSSKDGERLGAYWRDRLSGELPLLNLPTDRPRPSIQTFRGDLHEFVFDEDLAQKLKDLADLHDSTLFMVLLAAFQVLLHRYTGQDEILVGTPTAGRNRAELSNLIGYLVNPVVIRENFSEDPTFEDFLQQVRQDVLAAIDHQDYPFALLVEQLKPDRDSSRSPIFQAMFVWQETPLSFGRGLTAFALREKGGPIKVGALELEPYILDQQTSQFDLTLAMAETSGGLKATLQYNTDLFEAATVARMAAHFRILLEEIARNPGRRVSALSLVSEQDREQLLIEWNDTRVEYPDKCTHQFFEEQVERTPNAVAIVFEHEELTYRELNNRANQLARFLKTQGVDTEVLVGICTERSLEMAVAVLGVLKAGGGYVPLDPTYPKERLDYIVKDSSPSVILAQRKFVDRLPEQGINVVCLDTVAETINDEPVEGNATPQSTAYVIYTSGSTGAPKGVVIPHHSIVNHILWMQQVYPLEAADRVLQKTPFSFDASVWEFFSPLLSGATLVLAEPGGHRDRDYLLRTLRDERITILQLVPSQLNMVLEGEGWEQCPKLRRVFCGGETLTSAQVKQFYERVPQARLYNFYGPTEATIDATCGECAVEQQGTIASIGRPLANTQMYILDTRMQPVPIGVMGELYIGGAQVGRGYLHRPELTAQRFVPDPFNRVGGARLYRTGDIGRYLADGRMECLGRLDQQVKVRGYRIELGEVEAALREHEGVKEAVAITHGDQTSNKELIAYVVASEGLTKNELRTFLGHRLPEYMVPSAFVMLDALPLTVSGKVDRRALPVPDLLRLELEDFVAPENLVEEVLAEIWADVLGVESIGVHANFFALGGHSLQVTKVVSRVREVFDIELSVQACFQSPTIRSLGAVITKTMEERGVRLDSDDDQLMRELEQMSEEKINELLADRE